MSKKSVILTFLLLCCSFVFGQYNNSWIDYSQKYYRIPITSEGVYKVTYADLVNNGISVGDFDHRNLQIIHNGEVLPLYMSAQPDGIFRATDYFEFYAEGGNNGWLDKDIYYSGEPFNPAFSLYNDTASYFLTIANTLESPRYDTVRTTNYENYTPLSYCLKTVRSNYYSTFNETKASPYILPAEGWGDNYFDMGGSTEKGLITANYADVSIPAKISFGMGGVSETQHDVIVTLNADESFRWDTTYYDYNAIHKTFDISAPLSSTTTLKFQSIGGDKTADKNSVSYVEITYPCKLNFSNQSRFKFTLPIVEKGDYILLEITNFNSGSSSPILYCPEIQKRIVTTVDAGKVKVLIPNKHKELSCFLISQNASSRVSEITTIKTKNSSSATQFFDLTNESHQGDYIIITEKSLWSQAYRYASYRTSTGKNVVLIDIDELYNQFAYGIRKHPVAIQAFIKYATEKWNIKPEHVFLIGKGFHLTAFRNNETMYARSLIPSMGNPSSDLLYTMSAKGNSLKTNIAIGRLAAETNEDVRIYLNKVIDFEAQSTAPWMKNVMLFGGGSTAIEQSLFRYYLNVYENTLSGTHFGANVTSFFKESSDVYETTEPEAIRKLMNEGTSLMVFFGHASGSGFDQSIDHPSLFDNQGKYPLIVANSCYSGDIFADNDYNVSKIWTFTENRGSIGFLANVDVGIPSYLNMFSSTLMRNIAYSNYGESIGTCIANTMNNLSGRNIIYEDLYDGIVGFTLQGDPAVKIHSYEAPDLSIDESSISFSPSMITTDLENMTLHVAIRNNGRAISDSYSLKITFTDSKGSSFDIDTTVSGAYCNDKVSYVIDMKNFNSGEYTVSVVADYKEEIVELSEENNSAQVAFFVSARDILPIYPQEFAIIPSDTVTLIASSIDPFNTPHSVIFELDTVETFDSPLKQTATITLGTSAMAKWKPEMNFTENTTYLWRVSSTDSIKWNESSFTFEPNKTGWAQIQKHQFINNELRYLEYDDSAKKYSFMTIPHEVSLQTRGNCSTEKEYFECLYVQDATLRENSGFPLSSPALHIIVLDSTTLESWLSSRAAYGQRNYPSANGRVRYHLAFTSNDATAQKNLAKFLLDTVPTGNYILCYSFKRPYCQSWDISLKNAMDSLGFTAYKDVPDDYPYIFYTKKGDKTSCEEVVGESPNDLIRLNKVLYAKHDEGTIITQNIGPSSRFESVEWKSRKQNDDYSYLTLYAVSADNNSYSYLNMFSSVKDGLDTLINTEYFPYMKLDCYMSDPERTPIDLNYWKVYYTPPVEFAVCPEHAFSFYNDTIQQGDTIRVTSSIQNVSSTQSDSVLILYEIRNEQNELVVSQYKWVDSIDGYSYFVDMQNFATTNLYGLYTMKIEYNPVNPETGVFAQPEQSHFNNTYYHTFMVTADETAPVIDVQFDGRHLIDGDNVSATPEIRITLFDENPFYSVADTSLFTVYIKNITTKEIIYYHFADSSLFLATNDTINNSSIVYFRPEFTENGVYELHVQAEDVSGNETASQEYVIQFTVNFEQTVSILYNYPNPCVDFTTFRFILSGTEAPKNVKIRISDVQGHQVCEIPLSNVHIGTNDIDVYWNERLGNGLYFYQLIFDEQASWQQVKMKQTTALNKKTGKLLIQR